MDHPTHIQNNSIVELCEKFGTPLYIYDGAKIEEKVKVLKDAFSSINMKIKYACKANTNLSVLALMNKLGVDLDVVSPNEMSLGLKAGFKNSQITYTSSGVSFDEIEACVNEGVICNIDNLHSLELFGKKYKDTVPVILRLRPNIMAGGNLKISTGHKDSKFGIPVEHLDKIHELREKYKLKIIGVHQHTGSDIKDPAAYTEAAHIMFDLALGFPDLEIVDLGGGFKVAYKENDKIIEIKALADKLIPVFEEFQEKYGKKIELWFEPGKFLVSEAGFLVASVNVVKENPNANLIGLNTGLNHLIRPMMYDAYHEVYNLSKIEKPKDTSYNVVGYMCETDDIATDRLLPKTEPRDLIIIKNAGAYGFTMASQYNARVRPAEVLIDNEVVHLVRKRETFEDIIQNQILVNL